MRFALFNAFALPNEVRLGCLLFLFCSFNDANVTRFFTYHWAFYLILSFYFYSDPFKRVSIRKVNLSTFLKLEQNTAFTVKKIIFIINNSKDDTYIYKKCL